MSPPDLIAHIPGLRRYARALTGDGWAADDLVQDTLERACSKWRLWAVGSDLRAWLFTLMHNLHTSGVRQSLRRSATLTRVDLDDAQAELVAPGTAQDLALDLQRCLLQLPDEQRAVLLLVSLEDMSYEQVARITSTPIGTVMSRLSRARTRLQALMNAPAVDQKEQRPGSPIAPHLKRLK
ncbi:MAG: RNA polymerase sigma factor [Hydrogenophaga sp.]|jgi:RNA polymerase sigma-70 factor (ECF subfamily)|uniref:RNA polymerase sigma factor n=1 Tax=Hydrogenophaga sp. TaxID=1904254 RepID=UPI001D83B2AB|nr:RNA polymerase sigma factor [Hydrogenophaga sp.]MBW0172053.1 RNA polymerase sigma factor [Hydrogenophaga sp.]MBW0182615.1 RNA polymerase sigma factor [Hydrogenophaga sp.]